MDLEDFWKLAEDATLLFANTAASTASAIMQKRKGRNYVETSTRLGMLGAKLYIIHDTLQNPAPEEDGLVSKRLPKLLALLEALCTVGSLLKSGQVLSFTDAAKGKGHSDLPKDPRLRYPRLRGISSAATDQYDLATALVAFASTKKEIVAKCFSSLDRFGVKRGDNQPIKELKAELEEQALRVVDPGSGDQSLINQALYKALCCPCTCSSTTRQGLVCSNHWTRLQLYDNAETPTDKAIFDIVFSSTPVLCHSVDVEWQQLRFEIPKFAKRNVGMEQKVESHLIAPSSQGALHTSLPSVQEEGDGPSSAPSRKKKGVRFAGSASSPAMDQRVHFEEPCSPLQEEDFCQLLNDASFGKIRKRLKIEGGALHQMHDPARSDPTIRSSPSMPLSTMLGTRIISSKEKIVLAYRLARATWHYYNSDFMKVCWTSGTIHFMLKEPIALDMDDDGDRRKLDPSKPYFAFQFDGSEDPASVEFCDSHNVLHRYPRILALATLLTEIGYPRGGLQRKPARSLQEQINNDWNNIQNSLDSKKWPRFDFKNPQIANTYRLVVSICLDHRAFHISSSGDGQADDALVEQRRTIIFKNVVYPLRQLLSDSGLLEKDTPPSRQGEIMPDKDERNRRTVSYGAPGYTHPESGSRRDVTQPYISCSASTLSEVDTSLGSPARCRPSYTEYTVGWICAVEIEMVAACELLDDEYDLPAFSSEHDNNIYVYGRISQHKVVIASLPTGKYGTASAAAVARDMLRSFPSIKFGLMVGIAGGAPSRKHEIRLGDIVVSSPDRRSGGVVHYDFGKAIQSKEFQRTGSLNAPPLLLLNAVRMLSTRHRRKGHKITQTVAHLVQRNPRLKCDFQRPDLKTDRLYQAAYLHEDDSKSCKEVCDQGKTMLQTRPHRDETVIHYGLIASADRLMKDAQVRDALAEKEGILCFEMEASGLMDHFPCLVIRGICDYSDTHKNDAWQGHAAVAAAAYAKELLETIPPTEVQAS